MKQDEQGGGGDLRRQSTKERPIESDRRIFRHLNLRDANDCDECNELNRQKTRFASISIYALHTSSLPLPLLQRIPIRSSLSSAASLPSFSTLYMRQRERPSTTMGYFPGLDIAYNAGGYYEYYSINVAYLERETGN